MTSPGKTHPKVPSDGDNNDDDDDDVDDDGEKVVNQCSSIAWSAIV